ncbi:uncharacterized protein [Dermacentor andersoni]|uniref:uncharacterized protein n=1 Tax=Dermacentor andersoni TaxID=34620 RepID=UPI0024164872|nr:uncharacterized protein LOC129383435 [Dermacentor andersoni]
MELVDSDSDEEFDAALFVALCKVARVDRHRINGYFEKVTTEYLDFEFKMLFRLSRETFNSLCTWFRLSPFYPKSVSGRPQITAEKTCLITLSYLGAQTSMYSVADRFDVSESSVVLCMQRVLNFLQAISAEVICWPTAADMARNKMALLTKSGGKGPRNTVGCIDGGHIEILKPDDSTASYINRKKWASIIFQAVCNDQNRFLDVFIGFPGSVHDARVLRESTFFEEAAAKCGDFYILGDSAYPLLPWLMTPYKDNGSSFPTWKKKFTKFHSQQRVAIENCFGLLKQCFRRLYLVDAKTIMQCCLIVMGACVLHNMCNSERDFIAELADLPPHDDVGNDNEPSECDTSTSQCESRRRHIAQYQC